MEGRNLKHYGNSLIEHDIRRLKRFKSLIKDLEIYFGAHSNQYGELGRLSCQIANRPGYIVCKDRIKITTPITPPSKGGRLWFVISSSGYYIPCLLYAAVEEKNYKTSICFKTVTDRLKGILRDP